MTTDSDIVEGILKFLTFPYALISYWMPVIHTCTVLINTYQTWGTTPRLGVSRYQIMSGTAENLKWNRNVPYCPDERVGVLKCSVFVLKQFYD